MTLSKNTCESTSHIKKKEGIYEQLDAPQNNNSWIEIKKSAIEHNIEQYKKIIGNNILAPVIKGNAYGHGLIEIAHICQQNKNVEWLCVATLSEALELRKNKITKPILVLSCIGQNPEQAALQNISVVVYDIETINKLNAIGKNLGKSFNVHIKVDTGLSRLGVLPENTLEFIKQVKSCSNINIQGIWTHFAESHLENRAFTNQQFKKFEYVINKLEELKINIPLKHTCNSAGTSTINSNINNFFRLGIGFYGHLPSEYVEITTKKRNPDFYLKPILQWKTNIFAIKKVRANRFVGYDRTYQTKRDSVFAVLPIGYFDGYDRRLSNKGRVIINGHIAPVVGIVCMNVLTVDVTDLKNVKIGDQATLIGDMNGIRATELAKLANINPRELTTRINSKIPRIIVE